MINLYKYVEIVEILNIAIITSILVLSMLLYKVSKNASFLRICLIYSIEIVLFLFVLEYSKIYEFTSNISHIVALNYILKVMLFIMFINKIKFKIFLNIIIIIGGILEISLLNIGYELSLTINIIMNIMVIYLGIISRLCSDKEDLQKNRQKLKINKKYISKVINQIALEYDVQNQLKDNIINLNNKISESIEEVEIPIFILNLERDYIYSNKSFEYIMEKDGIDVSNFNMNEYLEKKFINSKELLEFINTTNTDMYNSLNISTHNNETYRFICINDIIDNQGIVICILNDITQSTLIQNKLKESEERYRNLMDILSDGVIIHNMNTINYINSKAIELFDIDNEIEKVLLIDDLKNQINKKFRQEFLKNINLVQLGKKSRTITKLETEEGKIVQFMTTSLTLNDSQMMLSLAIDITTLEMAMNELEESEKTYKLLLQTLPEGIVIIDKKSKNHTYRNKAMIKILKSIGSDRFNEIVKSYTKNEEYGKFKKFTVDMDEKIDISIAITDMKEEGNFLGVVRILDCEQKTERMVEKLNEMEGKYKFRTEFLSRIATDLKKPINTIFTVNNILYTNKDEYDSEYINNYTRLVRHNSYRLKRLLNNIDEISSIENGIYRLNFKKYDVVKLIKNIVELAKNYTDEKKLEILFSSNIDRQLLIIDKEKIEKIILNLLSNAIKFTDIGGKITISINVTTDYVNISIEDTGLGIPSDKIEVIFENFEQLDTTLSRGAEGTGVGLFLSKKLADLHDGEIKVKSKVGYGSKFELVLKNNISCDLLEDYIDEGATFSDKEKMDIEFSDIYFNLNS